MGFRFGFFSKTDTTPKERFFKPMEEGEDVFAGSGQSSSDGVLALFNSINTDHSYEVLGARLLPPARTLDDLLERILLKLDNCLGAEARNHFFEQLVQLLTLKPGLINRAPNKFHSNPLELMISLGEFKMAEKLLAMNANVRPENRRLLEKLSHHLPHLISLDIYRQSQSYGNNNVIPLPSLRRTRVTPG